MIRRLLDTSLAFALAAAPAAAAINAPVSTAQTPAYTGDVAKPAGSGATTIQPGAVSAGKMGAGAALSNINAGTDASKVGFGKGGSKCLALESYGGGTSAAPYTSQAGTAVSDNTAALQAAFAALPAYGGCIEAGNGTYNFASAVPVSMPSSMQSFTVKGTGEATKFVWTSLSDGLVVKTVSPGNTFHLRDLQILTSQQGGTTSSINNNSAGGTNITHGLIVSQSYDLGNGGTNSDVTNVTFEGTDGGQATLYWGMCAYIHEQSLLNFDHSKCAGSSSYQGYGFMVEGDYAGTGSNAGGTPNYGTIYNFKSNLYLSVAAGVVYGSYVQGVTMMDENGVGGTAGVLVPPGATGVLAQLIMYGCQWGAFGRVIDGRASNVIDQIMTSGNLMFVQPGQTGYDLSGGTDFFASTNDTFSGGGTASGTAASYGIVFGDTKTVMATVVGGQFYAFGGAAIYLNTNSQHVVLTNPVFGSGTAANKVNVSDNSTGGTTSGISGQDGSNTLYGSLYPATSGGGTLGAGAALWSQMWTSQFNLKNAASGSITATFSSDASGNVTLSSAPSLAVTALIASSTTTSTSATTGAVQVAGGIGVAKDLFVGGAESLVGNLLMGGALLAQGTYGTFSATAQLTAASPKVAWTATGGATDTKTWQQFVSSDGTKMYLGSVVNDANSAGANAITVTRSAAALTSIALGAPLQLSAAYTATACTNAGYTTILTSDGTSRKVMICN